MGSRRGSASVLSLAVASRCQGTVEAGGQLDGGATVLLLLETRETLVRSLTDDSSASSKSSKLFND